MEWVVIVKFILPINVMVRGTLRMFGKVYKRGDVSSFFVGSLPNTNTFKCGGEDK